MDDTYGDKNESIAFESTDFVDSSAGVGDAGKPIVLNASGLLDSTFINDGDIAHDSTSGAAASTVHTAFLTKDGTRALTGDWTVDGTSTYTIVLNKAPVNANDVVNKAYADAVAAGFGPKNSVRAATTANLVATYANGTGGVGATLTNNDTQAALELDGVTMVVGDRVLVKNQTTQLQNGIYTVTTVGDGSTDWVLTRATDMDNSPDGEIRPGNYTFVEEGTIASGYGFTQVDFESGDAVGTDIITFTLFSSPQTYTAGDGIDITGNQVSVDVTDIIDTNYGLVEDSNNIRVSLESDGGLQFDGANFGIEIKPDTTTASVVAVNLTSNGAGIAYDGSKGLTETSDVLEVEIETDGAIVFDAVNGGLEVNVDDSTIEISSNTLQVKADGINDTHIDFGTGANQVSAIDIPIADGGGYTTETEVEGALQELYSLVTSSDGVEYTAGTGGVTVGDVVYVSANDTASVYSDITTFEIAIGIAATTASAGSPFVVLANDSVISGILTGATAGTKYFWTGTGWTANLASFSVGDYIWAGGVSKNATDAHVEVEFYRKKS